MFAKEYVNEKYRDKLSMYQYTIPQNNSSYTDVLNEKGEKFYQETLQQVRNGDFKKTFEIYCLAPSNSGSGKTIDSDGQIWHCLNTFNNFKVYGYTAEMLSQIENKEQLELFLQTSDMIFYTDEWCLTYSGNLYRLKDKISFPEFLNYENVYEKVKNLSP
jgi:hypothetical protein